MDQLATVIFYPLKDQITLTATTFIEDILNKNNINLQKVPVQSEHLLDHTLESLSQSDIIFIVIFSSQEPYKAIKRFLARLPQSFLNEKKVIKVMIGGSLAHHCVIEYSLKPIFTLLQSDIRRIHITEDQYFRLKPMTLENNFKNQLYQLLNLSY